MLDSNDKKTPSECNSVARKRNGRDTGRKLLVCVGGKVFGINDVFNKEGKND